LNREDEIKMFKLAKPKDMLSNLDEILEVIPAADVLELVKTLGDAYAESQVTEREIARISAQKEILLKEIDQKYELYHKVFDKLFSERKVAVDKSFEIIDKGLEADDKELISMGLKSLSQIVSSSPFSDVDKLSKMLEGNQTITI